jgi:signal transduction histidine kinase
LSSNYTKPVGQLVQNSDHFSGNLGKPVRESDHLADTVLKDFKILIDRLIDGLEDERLKLSAGVLTTVEASMPLEEIALEDEPVAKRAVRIETYFNQRKGRLHGSINDWEQVHALAKEPIPEAFIFFAIDLAFARHGKTKRNPSEEINQFSYCRKVVDSVWFQLQNNLRAMSQTTPVPSGTVSRGQALKSKQALKNQEAKQKIREAEERERARSQENLHADPEHEWQL